MRGEAMDHVAALRPLPDSAKPTLAAIIAEELEVSPSPPLLSGPVFCKRSWI